jgi:hypothetical protein
MNGGRLTERNPPREPIIDIYALAGMPVQMSK